MLFSIQNRQEDKRFLIKSKLSVIAVIFFVLSLLFIVGCDLLNKNDDQPEITNETIRDAYEKVVEAHAAKQVVLYNIIAVYSNNYQAGQLFSYDPSYEELDTLLSQISALNDYKENIDYAVSIIKSTQQNQKRYKGIFTYHPEGLGSAIAGFLVTSEPMSINTKTNEAGTGTTVSGGGTERTRHLVN